MVFAIIFGITVLMSLGLVIIHIAVNSKRDSSSNRWLLIVLLLSLVPIVNIIVIIALGEFLFLQLVSSCKKRFKIFITKSKYIKSFKEWLDKPAFKTKEKDKN